MKILKSFIAALFIMTAMASQAHGMKLSAEEKAMVLTLRMSKYLQLTEAQNTEIIKIHQTAFEKMDLARLQFKENKPMLQKSRKEIFSTRDAELEKILSKEQFETFKQKRKEEKEKMKKEQDARKAARELKKANQEPVKEGTPAKK